MEEEGVILEKRANHFRMMLWDGGKLVLTEKHLIFKPHKFNIGAKELTIDIENIESTHRITKIFGGSNEFRIKVKNGHLERFIVSDRDEMVNAIVNRKGNITVE